MSVQNTSSPLNGPEPDARRPAGPELKRCIRCGRIGTRLFNNTVEGDRCAAVAACVDRQRQQQPARPLR
ncbi:hypothetical protein ACFWBI_08920 [Streptomyces sp. NPDC059982]|uniref:hypothetical protein n=1 Tax=Streptomyces sp. NPDC059982 TaxID=3347024 RepID=UPI00368D9A1F